MTELIPYIDFKTLRLSYFHKSSFWRRSPIRTLDNWEFMGGLWVGEAVGFTEFLRLTNKVNELGSVAVDLNALPERTSIAIFEALNLPLKPHASRAEVEEVLGQVQGTQAFVKDRTTFSFTVGLEWPYHINCTIHETDGLIYVVVIRKDILALCENSKK